MPCKYFLSQKGCKYGGSCKNVHSMNELSKGDRFKKCLNCGSKEHRAKDCDRPNKAGKSGPKEQNPKPGTQVAQVTPFPLAASTSQPTVQATPVLSPDLLQQAAEMYRQLQAMQVPQATQPLSLPAPQPTQPLTLPAPATEGSGSQQPSGTSQPSSKRLAITAIMPASCFGSQNPGFPTPPWRLRGRGWELPQTPKIRASQTPILNLFGSRTGTWARRGISPHSLRLVGLRCHASHETGQSST